MPGRRGAEGAAGVSLGYGAAQLTRYGIEAYTTSQAAAQAEQAAVNAAAVKALSPFNGVVQGAAAADNAAAAAQLGEDAAFRATRTPAAAQSIINNGIYPAYLNASQFGAPGA